MENTVYEINPYLIVIIKIVPVLIIGGFVAIITNMTKLVSKKTWVQKVLTLSSVVLIGSVASGIAVLGITIFNAKLSIEFELLIAAIAGSSGQLVFEFYRRKLFGIQNTRKTDRQTLMDFSEIDISDRFYDNFNNVHNTEPIENKEKIHKSIIKNDSNCIVVCSNCLKIVEVDQTTIDNLLKSK